MQVFEESQRIYRAHLAHVMNALAPYRDSKDLGLQALATASPAWRNSEVLLQALALTIARCLRVPVLDRIADPIPFYVPICLTSIERDVVDTYFLAFQTIHHHLLRLAAVVLPGSGRVVTEMLRHSSKDLRVVVSMREGCNGPLVEREGLIGNNEAWIDLFPAPDTQAVGACAVWCVEAEITRLQLVYGMTVLGTGEREAVEVFSICFAFRSYRLHEHASVSQLRGHLNRFGNSRHR